MLREGGRAVVRLLDGELLHVNILPSTTAEEITDQVNSYCKLEPPDAELFGLAFVDEKLQFYWLPVEKKILDFQLPDGNQFDNERIELCHRVKYFVNSVLTVEHPSTIEFYFMEAHKQIFADHLHFREEDYFTMASALLHVYAGDFNEDLSAVDVLRSLLPPSPRCLSRCSSSALSSNDSLSIEETERNILERYMQMRGTPRGIAIVQVMQIVEQCSTYGSRFYCVREERGQLVTLAVNNRGIYLYDVGDYLQPRKVFEWCNLDNIYYKDNKFTLEVKETRRSDNSAHNLSSHLSPSDDDLRRAVNEPTTIVSSSRRGTSTVHSFHCDTHSLCRSLWAASIGQHQFYLDQKTKVTQKSRSSAHSSANGGVSHSELSDKLNRLVSRSSIASSLPSLTSLHSASSIGQMPSAKVGDGSCGSLPSLKSHNSCEFKVKSEEERARDLSRYRILVDKKKQLEDNLLAKLNELRDICVQEGDVTGEMPKEMKSALMPGEEAPKLKRRVGTGFQISQDFLRSTKADAISQLESDIELHRKIVAAADRLAKDKSMNKSVRKKRQKDLLAAAQKLRGMELQLSQMKFSASKPDVSIISNSNQNTWTSGSSPSVSIRGVAKSCPTTPRGSVPDLSTGTSKDTEKSDYEDDYDGPAPRSNSGSTCSRSLATNRFSEASTCSVHSLSQSSSGGSPQGLPPKGATPPGGPQRRTTMSRSHTTGDSLDNPMLSSHQLPLYENVNMGYRSCASYQSAYRQVNYPTLQDQHMLHKKRAKSEHALNNEEIGHGQSQTGHNNGMSHTNGTIHSKGMVRVQKEHNWKQLSSDFCGVSPDEDDLTPCGEQRSLGAPLRPSPLLPRIPVSQSCQAGFSTASLDRRAVKTRITPSSSPLSCDRRDSLPSNRDSSPAGGTHRITTFPVGTKGMFYETTKPFDRSDIHSRFSSSSPQGRISLPSRPPSGNNHKIPINISQPSFPAFQPHLSRHSPSSLSSGRIPHAQTDPHMEALLTFYKDEARKQQPKTATIV